MNCDALQDDSLVDEEVFVFGSFRLIPAQRMLIEDEKPLRFLIGLAPAMLHRRYLVDPSFVDLASGRGPSTAMACQICAGVAATEALKILVGRGRVLAAPRGVHFDAYRNKLISTWRPGGYRHPMQRTLFALARRQFARMRSVAPR